MAFHGIHIKAASAEISKTKQSSNPAERKRATFAQNARKWHHGKTKTSASSKLYGASK